MPVSQAASAQPFDEREDLLGRRVGGEVEVVAEPAEQGVADRAADQVQRVARRGEALPELDGDRGDAQQLADGVLLRGAERGHEQRS